MCGAARKEPATQPLDAAPFFLCTSLHTLRRPAAMRAATLCVFLERNTARSRALYAVLPKGGQRAQKGHEGALCLVQRRHHCGPVAAAEAVQAEGRRLGTTAMMLDDVWC